MSYMPAKKVCVTKEGKINVYVRTKMITVFIKVEIINGFNNNSAVVGPQAQSEWV